MHANNCHRHAHVLSRVFVQRTYSLVVCLVAPLQGIQFAQGLAAIQFGIAALLLSSFWGMGGRFLCFRCIV